MTSLKFHIYHSYPQKPPPRINKQSNFQLKVNLDIAWKGIIGILGLSGCGKTTFLRAIAGLDRYSKANLEIDEIVWQDSKIFVPSHQRKIGMVFQDPNLFPHLTVKQNLEYAIKRANTSKHKKINTNNSFDPQFDEIIELTQIDHLLHCFESTLSGGEKQRVAIARTLLSRPTSLLFDEPLSALDPQHRRKIITYLRKIHLHYQIPIFYVSHSHREIAQLTDYLLLMKEGQITNFGSLFKLSNQLDLLGPEYQLAAVVSGIVTHHDNRYHLSYLKLGQTEFVVPGKFKIGESIRLHLSARDVSITTLNTKTTKKRTSILNIVPATVTKISTHKSQTDGGMTVSLAISKNKNHSNIIILAQITLKSADQLKIKKGKKVYAQIKSVAILT